MSGPTGPGPGDLGADDDAATGMEQEVADLGDGDLGPGDLSGGDATDDDAPPTGGGAGTLG